MEIIAPKVTNIDNRVVTTKLERAVRTAYQSYDKITDHSAIGLLRHCFKNRHLSVFEHHYIQLNLAHAPAINFNVQKAFYHKYLTIINEEGIISMKGNLRCFMDIWYNKVHHLMHVLMTESPVDYVLEDDKHNECNELYSGDKKITIIDEFYFMFGNPDKGTKPVDFSLDFLQKHEEDFAVIQFCMDVFNNVFTDTNEKYIALIPNVRVVDNGRTKHFNDCYNNLSGLMSADTNYYSFEVDTDIGVGREWLRHAIRGVTQESTRYCNYKTKGFKVICPKPFAYAEEFYKVVESEGRLYPVTGKDADKLTKEQKQAKLTYMALDYVNKKYDELVSLGVPPQQARIILPLGLKATFVITGHWLEWAHFCFMRNATDAHPQIQILADEIEKYFRQNLTGKDLDTFAEVAAGLKLVATVKR